MLELIYTSPRKTFANWDSAKTLNRFAFNKSWDCLLLQGAMGGTGGANGAGGTFKVFKDGHAVRCMDETTTSSFLMLEMAGGGLWTFVRTGGSPYTYQLFELDPFTATPVNTLFTSFTSPLVLGRGWFIDRERALILRPDGSFLRAYSLANPPVLQWSLGLDEVFYAIHWMADGKVMLSKTRNSGGTQTRLLLVDYREQKVLLRTQINPYRVAVYDSRCGVVMAINEAGYTEIYYPQAIPSKLTAPEMDPPPGLYAGSLVTTQVLGDMDEPCPDRVVHWYLENGRGGLAREASKSGSDGIASNYYFGPDNPALVGLDETIRVEALV